MDNVIAQFKAGKHKPLYVIVGQERFLIQRVLDAAKRAFGAVGGEGLNVERVQAANISPTSVIALAKTVPMFGGSPLVIVDDVDKFSAADLAPLLAYMAEPEVCACVVLLARSLDGRSALSKNAKTLGVLIEAVAPKPHELPRFVVSRARARGIDIALNIAAQLADRIGGDLDALDDAVERCALYQDGQKIDQTVLDAVVVGLNAESIWELVDAVADRNKGKALVCVHGLLRGGEPPLRVLAMVSRQLRMLARVREALRAGISSAEAVRSAGGPPFKAEHIAKAASRFWDRDLSRCFEIIHRTDWAMKREKTPADAILELAVIGLCQPVA